MMSDAQGRWAAAIASIILGIAFSTAAVPADGQPLPAQEIEALKKTVDALQERLDRLETERSIEETSPGHEELRPWFGVNLGLFGDVNATSTPPGQERPAWGLGEVGLYSTARYGDHLTFLFEAALEMEESEVLELERLWVGYAFSDRLTVRVGRVHTAIGYWNRVHHHARYFFPTVDRPFLLAFEEGVLPTHLVGLELTGTLLSGPMGLQYEFELGNGPGIDPAGGLVFGNRVEDSEPSKQVVLRVVGQAASIPRLRVGLSGTTFAFEAPSMREYIVGIDVAHSVPRFDVVAEGWRFINHTSGAWGGYLQLAWKLTETTTPFARAEGFLAGEDDPYLQAIDWAADRHEFMLGVRYDLDMLHSALKAQYRQAARAEDHVRHLAEFQWAFGF